MGDYKQLEVWKKAHQLTLNIYQMTSNFPKEEIYGLVSQIRRSALPIPSNIAEGAGRGHDTEFNRFLQIAIGSTNEVEYQTLLAHDLGFLSKTNYEQLDRQIIEIRRMLNGLTKSLSTKRR